MVRNTLGLFDQLFGLNCQLKEKINKDICITILDLKT